MLEARTVGAALRRARSDNAGDVIKFNKRTNDHFQPRRRGWGGGEMRQGGRGGAGGGNSCRVIESMKNEVLKARWFEQSRD